MKDIKEILRDIELSDEDRQTIISEVGENYRTINEVNGKVDRIKELEEQNQALTEQVGNLEGDGEEVEKLRQQVRDFEAAEEKRKAEAEEAEKRSQFRTVFDAAIGEREFANDLIRDSVFNKAYATCSATAGLDAKRVIEDMTKDADGIWKNPQQEAKKMPNPADVSNAKTTNEDAAKKDIAKFLFGGKE